MPDFQIVSTRRHVQIRVTRDLVLFVLGCAIIVYETIFEEIDRPYLLAVGCAMVGLPVYLASMLKKEGE